MSALGLIGVAISVISLVISFAAFSRMRHLATYPYVTARRDNARTPLSVRWALAGPEREEWEVTKVRTVSGGGAILRAEPRANSHGDLFYVPVQPPVELPSLERPSSQILVTNPAEDTTLMFWLRSKSNPAMKTKRSILMKRIAGS